ncbi:MAG: AhpC/TSA family protein [Dysgonamonadaceae bacterium]|jgi:peroxiredoxin|nr:AhpC/TSA family protein [Dysgonamonadaceae bacterium]
MKTISLFTAICILTLNACAKAPKSAEYEIKGKIGNYDDPAKIYLQYVDNNEIITQSETLKEGRFLFSGKIQSPSNGRLVIVSDGSPIDNQKSYEHSIPLIVGNEKLSINSNDFITNAVIKGSPLNDDLKRLKAQLDTINNKKDNLLQEYYNSPFEKQQNSDFQQFVQKKLNEIGDETKEACKNFIKNNPDSYISLMALMEYGRQTQDMDEISSLFYTLSADVQNTSEGKNIELQLSVSKTIAIGSIAPDFTQNDPEGNPIMLSDFRGKYLLLDFWASWCGPCRKENPHIVKTYNQYKDKNFEILGISLDNPGGKQNWLNAIQNDGLTWPQVSDLKGWQNAVAIQYNVQSIPQNFLIDPKGVIIAKNLRGEKLAAKLKEIFE